MSVLISFYLTKNQDLVRTFDHREKIGHRRDGAYLAFFLATHLEATPARIEPAFQGFELGDFRGDVKILRVADILKLGTLAHEEDLDFVASFECGHPKTKRIPDMFRLVGLQNDAELHSAVLTTVPSSETPAEESAPVPPR